MCIPCWPFTDVYLEEEKKKDNRSIMVFDPNTRQWVQIGGVSQLVCSFLSCFLYSSHFPHPQNWFLVFLYLLWDWSLVPVSFVNTKQKFTLSLPFLPLPQIST